MFSKKSLPLDVRNQTGSNTMARNGSTFSVIGSDVTITGNISATSELHVDGHVEGDISCASLVQGEGGIINGAITVDSARMAGTVKGSIIARDLVILRSAHIIGDMRYESLTIEQGAEVEGRLSHGAEAAHANPMSQTLNAAEHLTITE